MKEIKLDWDTYRDDMKEAMIKGNLEALLFVLEFLKYEKPLDEIKNDGIFKDYFSEMKSKLLKAQWESLDKICDFESNTLIRRN